MKKSKGGKMHDVAKPGAVHKGSEPFASHWSNHKSMGHGGGLTPSPAGSNTQYRDVGKHGMFKGRASKRGG